jgi:hypothetical protein
MPRGIRTEDTATLQMALVGYEIEKQKIEERIREVRAALGGSQAKGATAEAPRKRRKMSLAARRRIAAAQKKRWAEHRKKTEKA